MSSILALVALVSLSQGGLRLPVSGALGLFPGEILLLQ